MRQNPALDIAVFQDFDAVHACFAFADCFDGWRDAVAVFRACRQGETASRQAADCLRLAIAVE
jgi:hypothetical protein